MADDKNVSPQWTAENVLAKLRAAAKPGQGVSAQVFLKDDVADDQVAAVVQDIIAAVKKQGGQKGPVELGKVHRMAKSFSITAHPDVMAAIANAPEVKTILPSEVEDIYPKPVKRTPR